MIPDRPTARDLLETAAAELKQAGRTAPDGGTRLTLLMAASAVDMALREQDAGGELASEQTDALAAFSGETNADRAASLCRAIRDGTFDGGAAAETLHRCLLDDVRRRAAISNPRYLAAAEADWSGHDDGV